MAEHGIDISGCRSRTVTPALALEALESETRVELVLFTTRPIVREAANDAIRAAGFSPIHNVRMVRGLEKIPLLGTGKTDYRALKALLSPAPQEVG